MRFSCAPQERGGQKNKGTKHFSIHNKGTGCTSTAKGRTPIGGSASCKRLLGGRVPARVFPTESEGRRLHRL